MNITDLINTGANVSVTVSATDLREFALSLFDEAKKAAEEAAAQKMEDERLTTKEVKQRYNVGETALWRWAKRGYLTPMRLGSRRLYSRNEIEKIIKEG